MLTVTPRHAQLAIAIAALAPKRPVEEDKTVGQTKQPMVAPIGRSLRWLLRARQRQASSEWVITYRGRRVTDIRRAIKDGAIAAGLAYGRDVDGVTFHTIRYTAATLLADVPSLTEARAAGLYSVR